MMQNLPEFAQIRSTKNSSPFVIASIQWNALTDDPAAAVVEFDPNDGFLLGYYTQNDLTPMLTCDAVLPIIAP